MGKSGLNKKKERAIIYYFYQNVGTSSLTDRHMTQEEAEEEALVTRINEIWADKVKLEGEIKKKEEEALMKVKEKTLKEEKDPGAFIFPIRLKGKLNENPLADTGLDIYTMPYRIYAEWGREDIQKIDKGITMIDYTEAEAMGMLLDVLCQVGFTTLTAKFLVLDIPIDKDAPIVVGRGLLKTLGGKIDTTNRIFSIFDGACHQTFRDAKIEGVRIAESDSNDGEDYVIKRKSFGAPIYNQKS
ncbi:DNA-directed DNA polymerase, partial [Tanacetum coccineum]